MQRVNQEYFEEGDDLDIDFEFVSSEDEDGKRLVFIFRSIF
jgi:hypothetical protein